ncbi:hypothetical protein BGZ67_002015, partial [Mortierella alpina]
STCSRTQNGSTMSSPRSGRARTWPTLSTPTFRSSSMSSSVRRRDSRPRDSTSPRRRRWTRRRRLWRPLPTPSQNTLASPASPPDSRRPRTDPCCPRRRSSATSRTCRIIWRRWVWTRQRRVPAAGASSVLAPPAVARALPAQHPWPAPRRVSSATVPCPVCAT